MKLLPERGEPKEGKEEKKMGKDFVLIRSLGWERNDFYTAEMGTPQR